MWKIILGVILALIIAAFSGFQWLIQSIEGDVRANPDIMPAHIPYIANAMPATRGTILMVLTSTDVMGNSDKPTGYELSELARAYYVFSANGFAVEIASILGGTPPAVIDADDMGDFDYAFLNDDQAQQKVRNSMPVSTLDASRYRAVFFVGGKGAMFDFPDNPHLQTLIRQLYEQGNVVSGVCHGPAALVNVTLSDGTPLVADKRVSAFTNSEELLLISDAQEIFPFLLETKLSQQQAEVVTGPDYLAQIAIDDRLLTGQNPWSVWALAEEVVASLGYTPVARERTDEEHAVDVLLAYHHLGLEAAVVEAEQRIKAGLRLKKELIAVHAILGIMQGDLGNTVGVIRLLSRINGLAQGGSL
ncbi:type 1 glutamine amidotransferase domain-containing protein [Aestuariibacter halophilus]|uniref:Type 1 glutamine amidotransferase domain-containing protein n=1 Tax=Fluctibacter halophilus TaxID=226011 RepID=A0ABS8GBI6_9ALTE|nr:type 1 glutamine amidotransferase domain-containing protein [Aestuariibacter halophilus]MCC2617763.1 type 1 glutamine amidotransferase domain-containing protein [Aestuariibacter halophilus]